MRRRVICIVISLSFSKMFNDNIVYRWSSVPAFIKYNYDIESQVWVLVMAYSLDKTKISYIGIQS